MKIAAEGEATTGATGAETTDVAAEGEATTGAAGAETMDVAAEGEATTGASGDATYGSHLETINAGKEEWTKRQFTLQACIRPAEPPRPADEAKAKIWDLGLHKQIRPALIFRGRDRVP
jgi:hypothetical protein